MLKLVTELPLNLLSESASFVKNQLITWVPTNGVTQGIRSILLATATSLQALFKGAYYLLRTITSPITSFQAAHKIHPALGVASALTSIILIGCGLAALALFAPPIVAALAPSMGPGALALISALASPFTLLGVHIPTATAAIITLIGATAIAGVLHNIGRKIIYPVEQQPSETTIEDELPQGSNVADLLGSTSTSYIDSTFEAMINPEITGNSSMLASSFGRLSSISKENSAEDFKDLSQEDIITPS